MAVVYCVPVQTYIGYTTGNDEKKEGLEDGPGEDDSRTGSMLLYKGN